MKVEKKLVHTFFEALSNADAEEASEILSDDLYWTVPGISVMPDKDKESALLAIKNLPNEIKDFSISIIPNGITAEGSRVAAEAASSGIHKSGKKYNNIYHFLFIIENNTITQIKEYTDNGILNSVFG